MPTKSHPECAPKDPVELFLKHLFRDAIRASAIAAALAAGGCEEASTVAGTGADGGGGGNGSTGVGGSTGQTGSGSSSGGQSGSTGTGSTNTNGDGGASTNGGGGDGGGGGTTGDGGGDGGGLGGGGDRVQCGVGQTFPVSADGLMPAESRDYLAVRRVYDYGAGATGEEWTVTDFEVLTETGDACSAATDGACDVKVANHPTDFMFSQCGQICWEMSVVTTDGDEVRRWVTDADMKQLLGSIDTADEALLMVARAGYGLFCDDARTTVQEVDDGYIVTGTQMTADCAPIIVMKFAMHVAFNGEVTEIDREEYSRDEGACAGRRPRGLAATLPAQGATGASHFAAYLATLAHLEAASVIAFERMAEELGSFGAPQQLVKDALRAARDEVQHAEVMAGLTRLRGGRLLEVEVAPQAQRDLEAFAIENAVEGCVRETAGALLGFHQAEHATDRLLATAMAGIAEDETRHAALAWRTHEWVMGQLPADSRARVCEAQREALSTLIEALEGEVRGGHRLAAGLPAPAALQGLLQPLRDQLWQPALRAA